MAKRRQGSLPKYDLSDKDSRALYHVLAFKASLQATKNAMDDKLKEWRDIYRGIFRDEKHGYVGRSRLFLKEPIKGIDTLVANLVAALLPGRSSVAFKGRGKEDEDAAKLNEKLVLWQFDRTLVEEKIEQLVEMACWSGACTAKVEFVTLNRKLKGIGEVEEIVRDDKGNPIFGDDGLPQTLTNTRVIAKTVADYEGPNMKPIDPFSIWFNPLYPSIQEGPGVVIEYEASYEELLALEKQGVYKNVRAKLSIFSEGRDEDKATDFEEFTEITAPQAFEPYRRFKISEFWGLWDPDDTGEMVESVILVADDSVVLRAEENPFWHGLRPVIRALLKESGDGLGIGIPEIISSDCYNLNDITNQRLDNVTLILNAMMIYKRGSLSPHEMYVSPGHAIGARDDIGDIRFERPPDVARSAYLETQESKGNIRESIGATEPILGIPLANKTATEINKLTASANKKFLRLVKRFERNLIKPIGEFYYMINQQTLNKAVAVRLGIEDVQVIEPEQIKGEFDVIPMASTEMMTQADAQNLLTFLKTISETQGQARWDLGKIEERVGQALGVRDMDKLRLPSAANPPTAGQMTIPVNGQANPASEQSFRGII